MPNGGGLCGAADRCRLSRGGRLDGACPYSAQPVPFLSRSAREPALSALADHWLGTDTAARDVLARLIYGFRIGMLFSLSLTVIGTITGIVIGAVQGYAGGKIDLGAQRLIEIWSALPGLYVVILLGSIYGQGFGILVLVLSLFGWIGLSYYMRGEFFKLREQPYVLGLKGAGSGTFADSLSPDAAECHDAGHYDAPFSIVGGITSLNALDYLGFGLPPPTPSWGELLEEGSQNLQAPWLAISSVAALFITLMLATLIGEGIRDALDPKSLTKLR